MLGVRDEASTLPRKSPSLGFRFDPYLTPTIGGGRETRTPGFANCHDFIHALEKKDTHPRLLGCSTRRLRRKMREIVDIIETNMGQMGGDRWQLKLSSTLLSRKNKMVARVLR